MYSPVLPLTRENIETVFKTGVLTVKGDMYYSFGQYLGIPDVYRTNPLTAAEWWIRNSKEKRWRSIIYNLDMVGQTAIADELMPYSEPPSGV